MYSGIVYIADIFTSAGKIKDWNFFKDQGISQNSFLQWQGLISAIPMYMKTFQAVYVRPENTIIFNCNNFSLALDKSSSRLLRNIISKDYFVYPKSQFFFERNFQEELDWNFIYKMPFIVTICSSLRDFQWRLNHNVIYTNAMLFKMNSPLVSSELCTFCQLVPETIFHLFVDCTAVKSVWRDMCQIWSTEINCPVNPTPRQIILGEKQWSNLLNHVVLIYKKIIYNCKLKKRTTKIPGNEK